MSLWPSLEQEAGLGFSWLRPWVGENCHLLLPPLLHPLWLAGEQRELAGRGCPRSFPPLGAQSFLGEDGAGWVLLPFPVRNAQWNLPCLVRALPAAPPATPGPRSLPRFKCSLKTQHKPSVFISPPARRRLVLPVGVRASSAPSLLRKNPKIPDYPECPTLVLASWALFTANRKKKLPPLPVPSANSVSTPRPALHSLPPPPKNNPGE